MSIRILACTAVLAVTPTLARGEGAGPATPPLTQPKVIEAIMNGTYSVKR